MSLVDYYNEPPDYTVLPPVQVVELAPTVQDGRSPSPVSSFFYSADTPIGRGTKVMAVITD